MDKDELFPDEGPVTGQEGSEEAKNPVDDGLDASVTKLQELMVKKGFKDVSQLVDWASEQESKATQLRQDLERMKAGYQNPMPYPSYVPPVQPVEQPQGRQVNDLNTADPFEILTDAEKFRRMTESLKQEIANSIRMEMEAKEQARKYQEMVTRVNQKRMEDPVKFDELRPLMIELSYQFPDADLDVLYREAERMNNDRKKQMTEQLKKELGLEGVDPDKLKTVLSRVRTQPVSGAGINAGGGGNQTADILKAIAESDNF
jgi:hypothetical protein